MRAIAVAAVVLVVVLVAPAGAVPPKNCGSVEYAFSDYTVVAHGKSCKFARKWVLRYLKHGTKPDKWKCYKPSPGSNVKVDCVGRTKPKGDPKFRSYLGIEQ